MKHFKIKRLLPLIIMLVLVLVPAVGCSQNEPAQNSDTQTASENASQEEMQETAGTEAVEAADAQTDPAPPAPSNEEAANPEGDAGQASEPSADQTDGEAGSAAAPEFHWDVDPTDVPVPLDLEQLWSSDQNLFVVPGVQWGTDKQTLLDYYGVSVLSEYPIYDPELWFTFSIGETDYCMTPVFGFNEKQPSCHLYMSTRQCTAEELGQKADTLVAELERLYGEAEQDILDADALGLTNTEEQVWENVGYTWRVKLEDGFSQMMVATTYCNDTAQEIEFALFRIYR